jgi:hypothetical protein
MVLVWPGGRLDLMRRWPKRLKEELENNSRKLEDRVEKLA